MAGYGDIRGAVELGGHVVEVSGGGGLVTYTRAGRGGSRVIRMRGVDSLVLAPIYPVLYPKFVTRMILVRLREEVVIGPEEAYSFYMRIPVDAAVYAVRRGSFRVIDVIPLHDRPKLALYGPVTSGVVARVAWSEVYEEDPGPERGYAVSLVTVRNLTRGLVSVTRILIDSSPLKLYYRPGSWEAYTQEVLAMNGGDSATILYGDPVVEGLVEVMDPYELRPPRLFNRTDMPWGM